MEKSIAYLSPNNQNDLNYIVESILKRIKQTEIIILYFSLILLCFSCNNEEQNKEIIDQAEKIVKIYPDSVASILAKIKDPVKLNNSNKANYYRVNTLFHLLTNKAMVDDSLILFSLQYYKKHEILEHLNETYQLAAMYYRWNENTPQYYALLTDGLDFSLKNNDSINSARFYYLLGEINNKDKDYLGAIYNYKRVVLFDQSSKSDLFYLIGLAYANLNQEDSTNLYMNESIRLSLNNGDTISARHSLRNYADILYAQYKYTKALSLIKQSLSYDKTPSSNLYASASSIYLMLQTYDSAQFFLDKAKEVLYYDNGGYLVTNYNSIMSLQSVIDYAKGQNIERTEIGRFNDSVWIDSKKKSSVIEEKIITKSQLEQQNLLLTISKQRIQMFFIVILSLTVIGLVFVFFYIRNKRLRLEELEEKKEVLQDLLSNTMKGSYTLEKEHFFKKVLLQQLGLIRLVATSPTSQNQELLRQVSQITNKDIPTDLLLVWEDLYNTIDSIYDNFYTQTVNKYGNILIEKEIQLCCLLCAEFSTKEISIVTQQSVRTIYQRKTTVRQKLHMNEKDDIIGFLTTNFYQ
jgi:DNA-binding CsgD family transcriptional regulator